MVMFFYSRLQTLLLSLIKKAF